MTVRAKFRVLNITSAMADYQPTDDNPQWTRKEAFTVRLMAVTGKSGENASFFAATPTGEITLQTVNAEAAKQFKLDGEYYIDFTPAN